jgi:zinc transporter 2
MTDVNSNAKELTERLLQTYIPESKEIANKGNNKNPLVDKANLKNQEALNKLYIVSVVCFIFMIVEFIGGYWAGSIAIMSDAAHLLSDFLGFIISIVSIHISRQEASKQMSYGYHRAEVIGALVSVNLIWGLTIWLFYEATFRIIYPSEVNGGIMLITGILGLIFNIIMGLVLMKYGIDHTLHSHDHDHDHNHDHHVHYKKKFSSISSYNEIKQKSFDKVNENKIQIKHSHEHINHKHSHDHDDHKHSHEHNDHNHEHEHNHLHSHEHGDHEHSHAQYGHSHENVNIRAAIIHILGDLIQNVGVIVAALIIYFFKNLVIFDPICTYVFSIIVLFTTFRIVKDCIKILMEGSPDIDIDELTDDLLKINGVIEIHDVHIWSLSMGKISFSCHIISETPQITLKKARKMLSKKYMIQHATIQVEAHQDRKDSACEHDLH